MALIECLECKSKVSDAAAACPKCGHPMSKSATAVAPEPKKKGSPAAGVGILFFAIVGGLYFFGGSEDKDRAASASVAAETAQVIDNATLLQSCTLGNVRLPDVSGTTKADMEGICNEIRLTQGGIAPSSHFLVETAKATFVFRAHGYDVAPKDIAYQLMNIVEARGQADASEDVKFKTIEEVVKMYVGWNGHITPQDVNAFLRNAGESAHTLSDDGLTSMMAVVLQEKKEAGEQ
jgi:hypothetical protein